MENKELDVVTDVVIPAIIVTGLFLINGIILYFIFKKRKTIVYEQYNDPPEAAAALAADEHPSTSQNLGVEEAAALAPKAIIIEDNENGIEMERL